jgi:micrococcal nuclease
VRTIYEYNCTVISVVDGDTIHADVDLGCDTHMHLTLRLLGINAPEMPTTEGQRAKEHLSALLAPGGVLLQTIKDHKEKYGRYLAQLFCNGVDVNKRMVDDGFAVVYNP